MKNFKHFLNEKQTPEMLKKEFDGGSQTDWIIYNKDNSKLFCIAIWKKDGGWVLGEYVNMINDATIPDVIIMGYMTMLEAAISRDNYKYQIAHHNFNTKTAILDSEYWQALIPKNKMVGKYSKERPINLNEFLLEMEKLSPSKDALWTNF